MNEKELQLLAATAKLAQAHSQALKLNAETLRVLVQIMSVNLQNCPGVAGAGGMELETLFAQLQENQDAIARLLKDL